MQVLDPPPSSGLSLQVRGCNTSKGHPPGNTGMPPARLPGPRAGDGLSGSWEGPPAGRQTRWCPSLGWAAVMEQRGCRDPPLSLHSISPPMYRVGRQDLGLDEEGLHCRPCGVHSRAGAVRPFLSSFPAGLRQGQPQFLTPPPPPPQGKRQGRLECLW